MLDVLRATIKTESGSYAATTQKSQVRSVMVKATIQLLV